MTDPSSDEKRKMREWQLEIDRRLRRLELTIGIRSKPLKRIAEQREEGS